MHIDKINEFLNIVCNKIAYKPIRKNIEEELRSHIDEEKENYILTDPNEENIEKNIIYNMGDPNEIGEKLNKIHKPKLNIKLLIISFILIIVSLFVTYSIANGIYKINSNSDSWFISNIAYISIGLILGSLIYFFDYTKIKNKCLIIYIISTIIAIITITINITSSINKVNNFYINIPILNVDILLANLLCILYIISFAGYFKIDTKNNFINTILLSMISLIILSYCNSLLYLAILSFSYISIFIIEIFKNKKYSKSYKRKTKFVISTLGILIVILFALKYTHIRIQIGETIITPESNTYEYGMSVRKNILTNAKFIGSANITGNISEEINTKDWAYGLQDAEKTETFIFIIAKYGILFATFVLIAFVYIVFVIIDSSKKIKEIYGKYICIGLSSMIIIQSLLHILSNLCLIDFNNAILPLISYSGFEIITNVIIIAFILSIYRRKDILYN